MHTHHLELCHTWFLAFNNKNTFYLFFNTYDSAFDVIIQLFKLFYLPTNYIYKI